MPYAGKRTDQESIKLPNLAQQALFWLEYLASINRQALQYSSRHLQTHRDTLYLPRAHPARPHF